MQDLAAGPSAGTMKDTRPAALLRAVRGIADAPDLTATLAPGTAAPVAAAVSSTVAVQALASGWRPPESTISSVVLTGACCCWTWGVGRYSGGCTGGALGCLQEVPRSIV